MTSIYEKPSEKIKGKLIKKYYYELTFEQKCQALKMISKKTNPYDCFYYVNTENKLVEIRNNDLFLL